MIPLPKLPRLKREPKAKTHDCGCGCGTKTAGRFAPGHDSRLRGWVLRVERGIVALADVPDGERQAVERALQYGPERAPEPEAPKETKKARKERERQAKIAWQLAAIEHGPQEATA